MKKLVAPLIVISNFAFAQIGINTPSPEATFDITAKNATGRSTNVDGLLIPRIDRERAQSMNGVVTSTLIYVNSISTGTATGTAVNIDSNGYYYFDGTVWVKLNSSAATDKDSNIYNVNGNLLDNRTVSQGDKTLTFTGTATNAFSVDGSTFSVDAANNKVGIGTIAPSSILTVLNSRAGNTIDAFSAGINNCGSACGQGTARNITLFNTNKTNTQFASIDFIPSMTANGITGASIRGIDRDEVNNYAGLQFLTKNATDYAARFTIKSSGNIGIGTAAPTNLLHISSSNAGAVKIVDGTQGSNKVLTSDANGVATWKDLPASGGNSENIYTADGALLGNRMVTQDDKKLAFTANSTNAFSVDGTTFSVDAANNRVGIGTASPNSDFQVIGNEFRLGGASSQTGTVANPLLRIHSNANEDKSGGEIRFSEDNPDYGYYIRHNTAAGNSYGQDGLAIGSSNPGSYNYNPAKPGMFISNEQNIGFGTATPKTIFHVDGAKDNNINVDPTSTQQENDMSVTNKGTVGIGNLSPRGALDINKGQTNTWGLVLPTNGNVNNFVNPLGGNVIPGTIIYDSTNDCVRFYKKNNTWSKCVDGEGGGTVDPGVGSIQNLDCTGATNSGTLTSGSAASGVSSVISYTGGNGGAHNGQTVTSTGVTGLTATLSAGSFANGNGTLTYIITGTPSGSGPASFTINIGGQNCTLSRNVESNLQAPKQIRFAHYGTSTVGSSGDSTSSAITSQLQSLNNYGTTGHYKGVTGFTFPEVTITELLSSTGSQLKAKYDIINVGRSQLNQTGIDHLKDFANLGGVLIIDLIDGSTGNPTPLILESFNVTGAYQSLGSAGAASTSSSTLEFSNVWGDTKGLPVGTQKVRIPNSQLPSGSKVYATESAALGNSTIWTPPVYNGRVIIINYESPFWYPGSVENAVIDTNIEKFLHNLFVYAIEKARGA